MAQLGRSASAMPSESAGCHSTADTGQVAGPQASGFETPELLDGPCPRLISVWSKSVWGDWLWMLVP